MLGPDIIPEILQRLNETKPLLNRELISQVATIISLKVILIILHLIRLNDPHFIMTLAVLERLVHLVLD
jgi:hypothetical protein